MVVEEQQITHRIFTRGSMSFKNIQGILKNKFQNLKNPSPKLKEVKSSKKRRIKNNKVIEF